MLLLAVDTSTPGGSVAILRDGQVSGVVAAFGREAYSTRLFRQLNFLLEELHVEMREFDIFAVAAGPGSFTGLRVGLAAVKGWAEVFGKPIVAVSGLEAVAAEASMEEQQLIAAVMDARRGQIYAALFRREGGRLVREGDEHVCTAEEFLAMVEKQARGRMTRFFSPSPEAIQGALTAAKGVAPAISRSVARVSPVLAPVIAELALERAHRGEVTDALRLDANYIRRTDAEAQWKEP
ncbi:MAG TPA: tRNA (adenosine(37)-N6)-threonylcarbamoyltransferase complex dimerization subunit type 1 TsaB [Candidatus Limnocylindrales bacterium]|nr:tRNA (adenosine(37)-N6)-threonylcarbamoyltransferase complex dimerization subunit type 1 TsaB [Candidatus Limnocylindrales bacterium]